jgi:lipopolysaccharide export LptBFGC system permease protein LptF
MNLIDRYILLRFLVNFAVLFVLLFLFAISIDLILALDRFVEAAHKEADEEAGALALAWALLRLAVDFQFPRLFQFYAYLHGLVAIGAMAFTLAQMHRAKELVAVLAAGVSLQRVAMPFIVAVFGLSVIQLFNQELFLPRVAPLLVRDHGDIGLRSVDRFPVNFTPDARGNLLQSPSFDPSRDALEAPTILVRDERGRTIRRITAEEAIWDRIDRDGEVVEGWRLIDGRAASLERDPGADRTTGLSREQVQFYPTNLSPKVLIVHRHGQYAAMLSLRQIARMLETPGVSDEEALRRHQLTRFSAVLVNVLVMWLCLPTFLLRQPANLLSRSLMCAGVAIPALLGAAIFMMADLPGISPAVSVFLPVIVLIPIVLAQWTYVRT